MAKANLVVEVPVTTDEPVSLKDLGYKSAQQRDGFSSLKAWGKAHVKGFPSDVSKDDETEIKSGMQQRYAELKGITEYGVVEGKYIAMSELKGNRPKEVIKIGVEYAYHYTQQQFGKLKGENPELHKVVGELRKLTSTYVSNTYKELTKPESVKRERGATKDFDEFVVAWFNETAKQRLISGKARGDLTADDKRFSKAKVAFMTIWNAK